MFNKSAIGILVEAYVTGVKVISMMLIRCLIGYVFIGVLHTRLAVYKSDLLHVQTENHYTQILTFYLWMLNL